MINSYAVLVCALCYSGAAVLGYLTFGGFVREDVLMSYPGNRVEVQLAIGAMALKTYSTYPILLFCGREALRNLLQDCSGWDLAADPNAFRFTSIAVTIWFALSVMWSRGSTNGAEWRGTGQFYLVGGGTSLYLAHYQRRRPRGLVPGPGRPGR